jgi:hypothetical protein
MEQITSRAFLQRCLRRFAGLPRNAAILTSAVIALGLGPGCLPVPADEPLEYQVKAAFLLNFTKFIEWPPAAFGTAESPFTICVLGNNPFGSALDQIVKDEVVNGRRVAAQYLKRVPAPQTCQILFLNGPGKEIAALPDLGPGLLTVGEGETFIRDGGMISFVIDNHRVRFEINQSTAVRAGLQMSSKLLGVAKSVEK